MNRDASPRSAPPIRAATAAGKPVRLVWANEVGGHTFEVGVGAGRHFVKWTPLSSGVDLDREAVRLGWAGRFTPVPVVLDQGQDGAGSWLITAALPGENAVSDRWLADPAAAVEAVGVGLRALHVALPMADCPFSWSVQDRVADVRRRSLGATSARSSAARASSLTQPAGQLNPARWHPEHQRLSVDQALAALSFPPAIDQLVVCHGDPCAPNTLVSEEGRWTGHVDLGSLGVADRWADLAVASWSADWNYGPGWSERLLEAYGVDADPVRMRFYRLLWDLGP